MARNVRRTYRDLAEYLDLSGDTQVQLAAAVRADQASISRIARGDIVPRPHLAKRLARYCRIPLSSFIDSYCAQHPEQERAS